jgi:hypothetical protein
MPGNSVRFSCDAYHFMSKIAPKRKEQLNNFDEEYITNILIVLLI